VNRLRAIALSSHPSGRGSDGVAWRAGSIGRRGPDRSRGLPAGPTQITVGASRQTRQHQFDGLVETGGVVARRLHLRPGGQGADIPESVANPAPRSQRCRSPVSTKYSASRLIATAGSVHRPTSKIRTDCSSYPSIPSI